MDERPDGVDDRRLVDDSPGRVHDRLSTDRPHTPRRRHGAGVLRRTRTASLTARGRPELSSTTWAAVLAALVVGLVVGDRMAHHVTDAQARVMIVVVALGGAVSTVVKGIVGL